MILLKRVDCLLLAVILHTIDVSLACPSNCGSCNPSNICTSCDYYYTLMSTNTCQLCLVDNCQVCLDDDTRTCVQCETNYYQRNGNCYNCTVANCMNCPYNNISQCTGCIVGYGLDTANPGSNTCIACTQPLCQVCRTNAYNCFRCVTNYYGVSENRTCVSCNDSNCYICNYNYSMCTFCISGFGPTNNGSTCQPCGNYDPLCVRCSFHIQLCKQCVDGYGVDASNLTGGTCRPCFQSNCIECNLNYLDCTKCTNQTGLTTAGTCSPCSDSFCVICQLNNNICTSCTIGYAAHLGSCLQCTTPNCTYCLGHDVSFCIGCITGYGVDGNTGLCSLCSQANCDQCTINFAFCQVCNSGLGSDFMDGSCKVCHPDCLSCLGSNYLNCSSCNSGYLYFGNCINCCPNCSSCLNSSFCNVCDSFFYLNGGLCFDCPPQCTQCVFNTTYSTLQCTICNGTNVLTNHIPPLCNQLCGDSITTVYDCDNQIGIPHDGCNDFCSIQPNFTCTNTSVCSFNGSLTMTAIFFKPEQFDNRFTIRLKIYPPLHVFKQISMQQMGLIFQIQNENIIQEAVSYNTQSSQIQIKASFTSDFSIDQMVIIFDPALGSDPRFFASVRQQIQIILVIQIQTVYFYPSLTLLSVQFLPFVCYCLSALAWISLIIGLIFKKLAPLQAMFVVQFSWLNILWIQGYLFKPLIQIAPLKYSCGYNYPFSSTSQFISIEAPYLSQFSLKQQFFSNFNISMAFIIVPLVPLGITYYRMKKFIVPKPSIFADQQMSEMESSRPQIQQQTKQKQQIQQDNEHSLPDGKKIYAKLISNYQLALQCQLYLLLSNLIYYLASVGIFFKTAANKDVINIVLIVTLMVVYLVFFIRFAINPDPCGFFRYSFQHTTKLAMQHYLFVILMIILAVNMFLIKNLSFLPGIPIILMLAFTLLRRPYKIQKNNYRFCFNLLVMSLFVAFRTFFQYSSIQAKKSLIACILLLGCIFLLLVVIIMGLIFAIYDTYWYDYKLPKIQLENRKLMEYEQTQYQKQILRQLVKTRINVELQNQNSIQIKNIKSVVPQKNNLLAYSNYLVKRQKIHSKKAEQKQEFQIDELIFERDDQQEREQKQEQQQGQNGVRLQNGLNRQGITKNVIKDENYFVNFQGAVQYIEENTQNITQNQQKQAKLYESAYQKIKFKQ